MWFLCLLAGVFVPLLITPRLLFHYDTTPKIIVLALAAAWALLRIGELPREASALWSRTPGRWLAFLTAAQLVWFGATTATSSRPWLSLFGSNWRRFGLVETASLLVVAVAIAAALSARPAGVRPLLRLVVCAGLIASVYGIFQYFGIDPFQPVAAYQAHAGDSIIVRPPGTMGHADYFGWWLAVEFFCAIALARIETGGWKRVAIAAAGCICLAVLLSGTRAALLAIVVGVVGLALMEPFRPRRSHLAIAGLSVIVFTAFLFSTAGTRLRARAVWSEDEPTGGARPLLWRDSLEMIGARPALGFGPETFLTTFAPYQSEDLSRLFPDFHHESPHNLPLDAATAMGVPGLLLMIAWAGLGGFAARSAWRAASPIAAPLSAALIASGAAAMFSAASPGPVLLTFLVIAVLIASCPAEEPREATHWTGLQWFVRAASVFFALGLAIFGGVLAISEYRLQQFSEHPGATAYLAMLSVSLPGAAEDLYVSRVLQQQCEKRSDFGAYLACRQQTMRASGRALRTSDDLANAWYNLSMLSAAENEMVWTRRGLEEAINASPNWFKPHWALAKFLSRTGETKQATVEAQRAAFLDSNRDPEVVRTAAELTASRR